MNGGRVWIGGVAAAVVLLTSCGSDPASSPSTEQRTSTPDTAAVTVTESVPATPAPAASFAPSWELQFDGADVGRPFAAPDFSGSIMVFAASSSDSETFRVVDAHTGQRLWSLEFVRGYETVIGVTETRFWYTPDEQNGPMMSFDLATGEPLDTFGDVSPPMVEAAGKAFGGRYTLDLASGTSVSGDVFVIGGAGDGLLEWDRVTYSGVSLVDGGQLWTYTPPEGVVGGLVAPDVLQVDTMLIDARTGTSLAIPPEAVGGVVVGSGPTALVSVHYDSDQLVGWAPGGSAWTVPLCGADTAKITATESAVVVAQTCDGYWLRAFDPSTGVELASTQLDDDPTDVNVVDGVVVVTSATRVQGFSLGL